MKQAELIRKYNVAGPRYTSYPTVPAWDLLSFNEFNWLERVKQTFTLTNEVEGVSIYVHLPYCESLCTYCGCNTRITVNHSVEEPYIQAVLKEWSLYKSQWEETPRIREIHLGGGTPTFFSAPHLALLIEGLLAGCELAEDYAFSFEGHPSNTTREHLETLYRLGFTRVSFGIQDFDLKVQDAIHRMQSVAQVEAITRTAREVGYTSINFDLIYGLPFQTLDSIAHTVHHVLRMRPDRIAYYSYAHVPWMKPGQRKFSEADLPKDQEKRALYELGKSKLEDAGYKEVGMDHFALPDDELNIAQEKGLLHRNFMGYTSRNTHLLIGLGASSISDCWLGFSQNVKTVESYLEHIAHGSFPIQKGHLNTDTDLILRSHILRLMCTGGTSWENQEEQCAELFEGLQRLVEMESDGLVEISEYEMQVTPVGKIFLRNICMALDAHFHASGEHASMFSKTV